MVLRGLPASNTPLFRTLGPIYNASDRATDNANLLSAPSKPHPEPQDSFRKWDGQFKEKRTSRADRATKWRSNWSTNHQNPKQKHKGFTTRRRWDRPPYRPQHRNPVRHDAIPSIILDETKINSTRSNLHDFCFSVKWGGGKKNIGFFKSWCRLQWGKEININILPNDYYMIEFMEKEAKWNARNKVPYILDGSEVHVIDWQPNFDLQTHVLSGSKVWIRLYNCPIDYWDIDVIKDLGNKLGTFVSADGILEDKLWGNFLKICINTEHVSKIPKEIKIGGTEKVWIQRIEREDQLHICPKCFSLDHLGLDYEMVASIQRNYACM
ncbi:hypothetical protein SUGI_0312640 [Cryptomeria japonica]|nr:hypothetical protein SUGI_0312640 [Cryptomeria japonica]